MTRVMRVGAAQMGPRKDRQADEAIYVKNFDFFCLPFQSHSTFMVLPFSVTNLETSMALVKTCWLRKERRRTVSCSSSYKGELASIFLMPAAAWGLCGTHLRARARHLVGIDLSVNMLAEARQKGLYDDVVETDLVSLASSPPAMATRVGLARATQATAPLVRTVD